MKWKLIASVAVGVVLVEIAGLTWRELLPTLLVVLAMLAIVYPVAKRRER